MASLPLVGRLVPGPLHVRPQGHFDTSSTWIQVPVLKQLRTAINTYRQLSWMRTVLGGGQGTPAPRCPVLYWRRALVLLYTTCMTVRLVSLRPYPHTHMFPGGVNARARNSPQTRRPHCSFTLYSEVIYSGVFFFFCIYFVTALCTLIFVYVAMIDQVFQYVFIDRNLKHLYHT